MGSSPRYQGQHRHGGQIGHGDGGADDLGADEEEAAHQNGDGAGLAQHAAVGTQQQGQVAVRAHLPGHGQGGGGGEGVNVVHRMGVVGHGPGKAHGHGDTAHDGGVGEVVAQAAEELLDHHDGDEGAHNGHPPGEGGGHIEGQQHAGDHGREVAGGVLPVQ